MFTGLIEEIGSVKGISASGDGYILEVEAFDVLDKTRIGDSIAINGACQTVTSLKPRSFSVYVSKVTAAVTTLGSFGPGRKVNLERAMTPASRFGGHIVQGHVDGVGTIKAMKKDSAGMEIHVSVPPSIMKYIVAKGSVSVDGISLTVVSQSDDYFSLYLIPETLDKTIISEWKAGSLVNVEVDILAKYVERMLSAPQGKTEAGGDKDNDIKKKLFEEGFM